MEIVVATAGSEEVLLVTGGPVGMVMALVTVALVGMTVIVVGRIFVLVLVYEFKS